MFFSLKAILAVFLVTSASTIASARDDWKAEQKKAREVITKVRLDREISFLADSICQGRAAGSRGSAEAAMWIQRKFEKCGLMKLGKTWTESFYISDSTRGRNVMAMLPSARTVPCDRYVIVGAHYDHLGCLNGNLYPGADANASGVTAMTSLAEMFSEMRKMGQILGSNIIFVAFDGKEHDMKGSEAFWSLIESERLKDPLSGKSITEDKITLMVNIDQIGSTLAPVRNNRKDYLIMLGTESLTPSRRNLLEKCNKEYPIGLDISLDYYGSTNFTKIFYRLSDQKVFVDNRIPSVLFTSGITMNTNKTWDLPESLDMEIFRRRIWLIFQWLELMTQP